jgi:homoserine O-succinyltransferase
MPVKIPDALPATRVLTEENVFVMTEKRSLTQDIRPLRIAIVNLMPTKEKTETQLLRLISNSPLQVEITLLRTGTYEGTHVSADYLDTFYRTLDDVKDEFFDGVIITGAPVEKLDFSDVLYWDELTRIMDWTDRRAFSTRHICWAAQAGLFYHYGVEKHPLPRKLFGVYETGLTDRRDRLLCGFDDTFIVPMSRHTALDEEALSKCDDLVVLATSPETGAALLRSRDGRRVFATGHSEYDRDSLAHEYYRDLG